MWKLGKQVEYSNGQSLVVVGVDTAPYYVVFDLQSHRFQVAHLTGPDEWSNPLEDTGTPEFDTFYEAQTAAAEERLNGEPADPKLAAWFRDVLYTDIADLGRRVGWPVCEADGPDDQRAYIKFMSYGGDLDAQLFERFVAAQDARHIRVERANERAGWIDMKNFPGLYTDD